MIAVSSGPPSSTPSSPSKATSLPSLVQLRLRHADGVLLSCDIQLIASKEDRQKHVQFLGMSAEMWPEIVNGERTDRFEMFFTVHSTSSKIKETDRWLDSRKQPTTLKEETHYELCTCGRQRGSGRER